MDYRNCVCGWSVHQERLTSEAASLAERIRDAEVRPRTWLELAEQAFSFVNQAKKLFDEGDSARKRVVLNAIGSNWRVSGGKVLYDAKKPFLCAQKTADNTLWWAPRESNP